jgi:hypothetical protein
MLRLRSRLYECPDYFRSKPDTILGYRVSKRGGPLFDYPVARRSELRLAALCPAI